TGVRRCGAGRSRGRRRGLTGAEFRRLALSLPEAVEGSHMGHPDFRVRKKIFATLNAAETAGHVRCDPVSLDLLVRRRPERFRNAWGGRWLGIELERVDEPEVLGLLRDAWLSIAPASLAARHRGSWSAGSPQDEVTPRARPST